MSDDYMFPIVWDIGSHSIKAGFADPLENGDPRAVFPTLIGRTKEKEVLVGFGIRDCFIGDEADSRRGYLKLKNPIQNGIVTNFDDIEKIYHHLYYNELRVAPEEHKILVTDPVLNPRGNRERIGQILMETFSASHAYFALQAPLPLYAFDRLTGLCFDCGHDLTTIVPVCEGYGFPLTMKRVHFGGSSIEEHLQMLLHDYGYYLDSTSELPIVRSIKEKLCHVSKDYEKEMSEFKSKSYELPDGSVLTMTNTIEATEPLFKPSTLGFEFKGLHHMIHETVLKAHVDTHKDLFNNIVISGGTTKFTGFIERLDLELKKIEKKMDINLVTSNDRRQYHSYTGATMLATMSSTEKLYVSQDDYNESGPNVFNR